MTTKLGLTLAAFVSASGFLASNANAALISFDLTQFTENVTTTTINSGGITLTASNFSPTTNTKLDSDGLCFAGSTGFCPDLVSLALTFSDAVRLISYQPGFLSSGSTWTMTLAQGGNSSIETNFLDEQVTNFNNQFSVLANQTTSVNTVHNGGGDGSLQIRYLSVEYTPAAVPEPAMPLLLSTGLGVVALLRRRKKQA